MTEYIVDTNVPLVASEEASQMSPDCVITCVNFLEKLMNGEYQLVIDSSFLIIGEYANKMQNLPTYTFGGKFYKWILAYRDNPIKVKQVDIQQLDEYNFSEVPQSLIDINFDNSDRKFVAVSIANKNQAPIVQAADSKWIGWEEAINKEGISVCFLCKEELKTIYQTKRKK